MSRGDWTIIAHSRFQVDGTTQYDIAIGVTREVLSISHEIAVATTAKTIVWVLTVLVMLVILPSSCSLSH